MRRFVLFFILAGWSLLVAGQARPVSQESGDTAFPFKKGNLLFNKENMKMNYVKHTEVRRDTLLVKNAWDRDVYLTPKAGPAHISLDIAPDTIAPGDTATVVLAYDAGKKRDFGYVYENFTLKTNDTEQADKFFFLMVYLEEDFSGLSEAERKNAPVIRFKKEIHDFGKIKQGEKIKYYYEFTNEGKSDLIIRRVKASCGCTATEPDKTIIKPGETGKINVNFDSAGLTGEQNKTVFVYCNDPRYSTVALHLKGEVIQ
ncbi:MAG TPA: DUF1573 domain-containing protein [Bacteroidales bacterium]|nr:DUF1573 domain-containing protein [Bacteroidales bacterium]HSA44051.1 DUF1573 domain-containing protein [Bacteroidales bacterium]